MPPKNHTYVLLDLFQLEGATLLGEYEMGSKNAHLFSVFYKYVK